MRLNFVLLCIFWCANAQFATFNLGGVLSGNSMAGVPLGLSLGNGELDVEGICSEPGFTCQNCTHAITCVLLPIGYLKVPLQECPEGQSCNAQLGQCTDQQVPECQEVTRQYQHTCEQVGIFPDAHDCRKFHLCSPPDGAPFGRPADHRTAFCPRHYGYNPHTAQCSIKLTKGQCSTKLVPDCFNVGQNGVLSSSPNHYYVCLLKKGILYPQVFLCPHGWYFLDGYCRPDSEKNKNEDKYAKDKSGEDNSSEEIVKINDETTYSNTKATDVDKSTDLAKTSIEEMTTSRIESFFSTDKSSTFAPDAFLADKFDLTNYESTDDITPNNNNFDYPNSFETSHEFW